MSATIKHTPGPWSFTVSAESGGNPSAWNIIAPCGGVVAETGSGTDDANARLIAAAPDLLAALEEMLIANHGLPANENEEHDPVCARAISQARAAIAKAKGPTEYVVAVQEAAAWRAKAARGGHPGRGFCLEQAQRWEASAIAKAKGGAL